MKRLVLLLSIIAVIGIGVLLYVQFNLSKPVNIQQLLTADIISTPIYRAYVTPVAKEKWGRDPFLPQVQQTTNQPGSSAKSKQVYLGKPYENLRLNGVFIRGTTRIAVVNNRPLKIGDQINGLTVSDIQKGFVKFDNGTILKIEPGGGK